MEVIRTLLSIYVVILILDAILSYFPNFSNNQWRLLIKKAADYTCGPIRKKLPPLHLPFDFSPLIVILLIQLFRILW